MIVTFRPSLDEHIEFQAERQKQLQANGSSTITWAFFTFNLAVVPGILIFQDLVWAAVLIFFINAVTLIVLVSWQQKSNLRKYYEDTWPELDQFDCDVSIDERGLSCDHAGNKNFYPWRNVRSINSAAKQIAFEVGPINVLLSKRAFTDSQHEKEFIALANSYKNDSSTTPE